MGFVSTTGERRENSFRQKCLNYCEYVRITTNLYVSDFMIYDTIENSPLYSLTFKAGLLTAHRVPLPSPYPIAEDQTDYSRGDREPFGVAVAGHRSLSRAVSHRSPAPFGRPRTGSLVRQPCRSFEPIGLGSTSGARQGFSPPRRPCPPACTTASASGCYTVATG